MNEDKITGRIAAIEYILNQAFSFSLRQCDAPLVVLPKSFDVPVAWLVANISAATGTSSLAQWRLRFNAPLLTCLVTQALQSGTSVRSAQAALQQARACKFQGHKRTSERNQCLSS